MKIVVEQIGLMWGMLTLFSVFAGEPFPTLKYASPADAGMSKAVLKAGLDLYEECVHRGELVGAVLLVARNGKVVLHDAVGWRDRARNLPMEKDTMFRMASNTKAVVATAVATLVEDGTLAYGQTVRRSIPSFDNYRAGFITIHHLLTHTSGLRIPTLFLRPYMETSSEYPDAPNLKLETARFGSVGAEMHPGDTFSYSNPGYNTLGALVEIASGQPLETFLHQRIYRPLGMVDSYHHEVAGKLDGKLDRMSVVYYEKEGDVWKPGWTPGDSPRVPFVRASGGMISTAWDYAILLQTFLNEGAYGDVRLLKETTVRRMTQSQTGGLGRQDENDGELRQYGYGWFVRDDGVFFHGGSDGTYAWVDPQHDIIGLVLTQTPKGNNPRERFVQLTRLAIDK